MELFVADEYRLACEYLNRAPGRPVVVDLGANIGLFSLACAHRNRAAIVEAYEPAPPNCDQFRANLSLNESLSERVALRQAAVGPERGHVCLSYEESAPASANVFASTGKLFDVEVVSLKDVVDVISGRVNLLKIDIEGAEYELLRGADRELWTRIDAIALELHDDPSRRMTSQEFLEHMSALGFRARKGPFISLLLTR
jgi:FkbM family methyltransferase